MSEPEPGQGSQERLVPHVGPEYRQRYARLAMVEMMKAMQERVEGGENFDPTNYTHDQIVTMRGLVFYLQGPSIDLPDGLSIPSSRTLKLHTLPGGGSTLETSVEITLDIKGYSEGEGELVRVQRGLGYADPNLTEEELAFIQHLVHDVRAMAASDDIDDTDTIEPGDTEA